MAEFQEGTLDTLMERLCSSISGFDPEWGKRCVPVAEEQIQQLQDILAEYHDMIPAAYLYYLKRMGQDEKDLEKGVLCFAYSDPCDVGFYMKLSSMDDNPPVVTDNIRDSNAESFEKYLFQRAFHMYQHRFAHRYAYSTLKSNSV